MANLARTIPKNAAIGVALLALSGSLLVVDVGATRAAQPDQPAPAPAPVVAVAVPAAVARAPAAVAPAPARPACALPASHGRPAGVARPGAAPHWSSPHVTLAALIVRHVERRNDHPRARLRATPHPIVAHAAMRERRPVTIVQVVAVAAPRTEIRPRPAVAPHPSGKPAHATRSAVEAAQYFAIRTVKAQTPFLEHVAAVTRKRGSSRLVVHIVAKTAMGTLVEFEVLRRNGIGFAIESRTTRFVALSTRAKAAARTSSGQDMRKGR